MDMGDDHQRQRRPQVAQQGGAPYHVITVADVYNLAQAIDRQMTSLLAEQQGAKAAQAQRDLHLTEQLTALSKAQGEQEARLRAIEARRWPLSSIATICSVVAVLVTVYGLLQQ